MLKRMKTFLFINSVDFNNGNLTGGHKRFLELVKSISEKNDVVLVSRKKSGLEGPNIKNIEVCANLKTWIPSHWMKIIIFSKILRREKSNIKYDYAISFGPADTVCYKLSGYDNIITLFREDFVGYRKALGVPALKMLYYRWLEGYAVKNSEKIIVQCEDDKRALIQRHRTKVKGLESKIYVQINNVNASWMNKKYIRGDEKNDNVTKIAFIGNFSDNRKGHQLLLPAVCKLIQDGYKINLRIAGDGRELEKYKDRYKNCKSIVFMGRVSNVGEILMSSDFEVVPSLIDSCPNTVLEGIALGVTVYGTNVGGIKDILEKKDYMFEPTVDSIYEFIKKAIDEKRYVKDAIDQKVIKERLTFDWGDEILKIIIGEKNR